MTISLDAKKKAFYKNPTLLHGNDPVVTRNRRNIPQHNKGNLQQPYSQYQIKWRETQVIPLKSGTRQDCPLSTYLFILVLCVLATAVRQPKVIMGYKLERMIQSIAI